MGFAFMVWPVVWLDNHKEFKMTQNYEIRLSDSLKSAWAIFCKAPEVYLGISFAIGALLFVLSGLPVAGPRLGGVAFGGRW